MIDVQGFERSNTVKNTHPLNVSFSLKGNSYLSKKAADLLNINEFDLVAVYYNKDFSKIYFVNDGEHGCIIKKNNGLWRFCDTKTIALILKALQITETKHTFKLSNKVELINNKKALQIINQ